MNNLANKITLIMAEFQLNIISFPIYDHLIAHASRVDRKTTIKNALPGYATRDGHMTWSRDGHMTKVPDCSKLKNKNIIKINK